ncbi:AAA domain-containing protein [Purpureocillium lavendulum]|uniref:AAA domain-containing protein n=1 Tax=Purpureocillium lavendulum TaxID=1247861 RepID=A0AB34FLQ5_9HYPO|nr:AAA domain-containing protein [Purpureocillium lavendulum]
MADVGTHIWINGFPGVGKLTVAMELHRLLPNSVLIDNHQLIDVVQLPRDHPDYNAQRERVRREAFAKWVHPQTDEESACGDRAAQLRQTLIFTDCLCDNEIGAEWAKGHLPAAEKGGRPFLPVYLTCAREENLRRVVSPGRTSGGRKKLVDAESVGRFLDKLRIFTFPGLGVEIDTTNMEPHETAQKIIQAMQQSAQ